MTTVAYAKTFVVDVWANEEKPQITKQQIANAIAGLTEEGDVFFEYASVSAIGEQVRAIDDKGQTTVTKQPAEDQALDDADYTLADGAAWFTIQNISIRIHATDEGVVVDLYPRELEMNPPLTSAYAFFSEAENELDAYAKENG